MINLMQNLFPCFCPISDADIEPPKMQEADEARKIRKGSKFTASQINIDGLSKPIEIVRKEK